MDSWNLNETYDLVRAAFGREQEKLARASIRSVNDRKAFSSYHFREVNRLTEEFEREHMAGLQTILEIHTAGNNSREEAFHLYIIKVGANSIAAVQSLHALPDIFSHALYFASGQNLKPRPLAERDISAQRVMKRLSRDEKFASLAASISALQSGAGWGHLAAISNMSKHRSVILPAYTEDWTGSKAKRREVQVSAFVHDGESYPSCSLRSVLEPEYERLMRIIIEAAHQLNSCLRATHH